MEDKQSIVQELQSTDFLDVIRSFLDVIKSCLGPKGGIKVLVTSGGISIATSSSLRLLNNYIFSHPMCILVSQIMKSQTAAFGDSGLYIGFLALSLLERNLKQNTIRQSQISEFIQDLTLQVHSLLELDSIKLKLDLSTVSQLLPIVKTILSSKPGCGLIRNEVDSLSVQIVKVFLNTVNNDFGEVILLSGSNTEGNRIVDGILYQIDIEEKFVENFVTSVTEHDSTKIHLLLFDIMLTDPERNKKDDVVLEDGYEVLKNAMYVFDVAIKIDVKIIACQKVVHDSLRLLLQRNGILLMDRLGSELCSAVEKMSGAKPISSLRNITLESLKSCVGTVDSINHEIYGHASCVVLKKNNTNVATLLLSCPNDEAFAELKLVTQQALKALRQVVCQPFVLPGAGCLEMWLATQLRVQDTHTTADDVFKKATVGWLQKSLISITSVLQVSTLCIAADTVYCHSWSSWDPDDSATCCCGLVQTADVKAAGGLWVEPNLFAIDNVVFPQPTKFLRPPFLPKRVHENAIVDVYVSKCNAVKLALDTCVNMLSIGVMVHKPPI